MHFDELTMHKTVILARRFTLFGMASLGTAIGLARHYSPSHVALAGKLC